MSSAGGVTLAPAVSEVTDPTALQSGCGEPVLLPESFRGGCSFGASSAGVTSLPIHQYEQILIHHSNQ